MKKRKRIRKPQVGFEVDQSLADELRDVVATSGIPAATIAREGLRDKIAEVREKGGLLVRGTQKTADELATAGA